jgi:hypothetical protein
MKKLLSIFFLLSISLSLPGFAQTAINLGVKANVSALQSYYVSNSGSGINSGATPALAITPGKLMTLPLSSGQTVFFARGETFSDFELPSVPAGVTFDAYGTGTDPVLRGGISLSGVTWTSEGSNVYSVLITAMKWLYINGVEAKLAETPWYTITSQPSANQLRATSLISAWGGTLVGAKVVVKEYYFTYSRVLTVTAYDNTTGEITLSGNVQTGLTGFAFKLFDQQQFLTANTFYYSSSATKLYYKTSGSAPTSTTWTYSNHDTGFTLIDNANNVTIQNLAIREYYVAAIRGRHVNNLKIQYNTITAIRQNAIFVWGNSKGLIVTRNNINNCGQNGLLIGGGPSATITYNTIRKIGTNATLPFIQFLGAAALTKYEQGLGSAICFTRDTTANDRVANYHTMDYNTIDSVSYCGILFMGSYHSIRYNEISNHNMQFVDGGGIYCIRGANSGLGIYDPPCDYNIIAKNIIHDGYGSQAQTPNAFPQYVFGIYVDIKCSRFTIDANTIYNNAYGGILFNYGCYSNSVTNNTLVDNGTGVLYYNNSTGWATNTGNTLTGNTIVSRNTTQYCVTATDVNNTTSYNPFTGGASNQNYYINPYSTSLFLFRPTLGTAGTPQTLAQWKSQMGKDVDSRVTTILLTYNGSINALLEVPLTVNRNMYSASGFVTSGFVNLDNVASLRETIPAFGGLVLVRSTSVGTNALLDNFTGTGGTGLAAHTPDTGGPWTVHSGTTTLNGSGFLQASASANATVNTNTSDPAMVMSAKIIVGGGGINMIARHNGVSTGVANESYTWLAWYGSTMGLYRKDTGGTTTTQTATLTLVNGTLYTIEFQLIGNRAIIKVNSATVIDYTGSELTLNSSSTRHGVRLAAGESNIDYLQIISFVP